MTIFAVGHAERSRTAKASSDGKVRLLAVMGGEEYVGTTDFGGGEMTAFMGGTVLDLRGATIPSGEERVVEVHTLMGGAEIRVPQNWAVSLDVTPMLGGVNDQRRRPGGDRTEDREAPTPPRLVLRGNVVMGGVVLKN